MMVVGKTQPQSQSNEPSLNSSDNVSRTWNELYSQGQSIYAQQKKDLIALRMEILILKNGSAELTNLCNQLSQNNEGLKVFNEQIGQRMQESDEWNAELQDENVKLEADVKVAKAHGLRNTIITGIAGLALGILLPFIIKLLRTIKIIP
jgi:UDP-N-acetylmuramoylalanine-D-glutamate ligase